MFLLSAREQYAVLIVKELKGTDALTVRTLQDINSLKNLSLHFLQQVARDLRIANIIASRKGPGGGYYLLKNPSFAEVLKAVSKIDNKLVVDSSVDLEILNKNIYNALGTVNV